METGVCPSYRTDSETSCCAETDGAKARVQKDKTR